MVLSVILSDSDIILLGRAWPAGGGSDLPRSPVNVNGSRSFNNRTFTRMIMLLAYNQTVNPKHLVLF